MAKDRKKYLKDYRAKQPHKNAAYMEKMRNKDAVVLFHLKRLMISKIALPDGVAADQKRIDRMQKIMEAEMATTVVVEVREL